MVGLYLTMHLVPARDGRSAHAAFEAITRLDGVKMFLLAGLALATRSLIRDRRAPVPGWLSPAAVGLAITIAMSGAGYLLLVNGLALAAWLSLPLLLVWVCGVGFAIRPLTTI